MRAAKTMLAAGVLSTAGLALSPQSPAIAGEGDDKHGVVSWQIGGVQGDPAKTCTLTGSVNLVEFDVFVNLATESDKPYCRLGVLRIFLSYTDRNGAENFIVSAGYNTWQVNVAAFDAEGDVQADFQIFYDCGDERPCESGNTVSPK